ncbi:MAG: hypothetical protein M1450_02240 [Patescibacteria group bacterium]|nr:hypothetical protein [Patescibacteria group bacterium]
MNKLKNYLQFLNSQNFVTIEKKIISFSVKLPKLPPAAVDFLVSFGPYLILLGGILNILSILSFFSLGNIIFYSFSPFIYPLSHFFYIAIAGTVLSGIILITAFEDLKNLRLMGWRMVFWATNLSVVTAIFSINFIGAIIGALVYWYFLSQIYSKYH